MYIGRNALTDEMRPLLDLVVPLLGGPDAPDVREEVEHLPAGEHVDDGVELRAVADLAQVLSLDAAQVVAQQPPVARRRPLVPRQHAERRRLARAVHAQQAEALAWE